jgi:hypothetical protein
VIPSSTDSYACHACLEFRGSCSNIPVTCRQRPSKTAHHTSAAASMRALDLPVFMRVLAGPSPAQIVSLPTHAAGGLTGCGPKPCRKRGIWMSPLNFSCLASFLPIADMISGDDSLAIAEIVP